MPTETFKNLSDEKRTRFIEEALREFAQYNFETASINRIIKNLGIARGSVYQYFTDKLDLWLFLKEYAEQEKMHYILGVRRENFTSFWEYYEEMYRQGIFFDLEKPLCSQFLYRVGFKENSQEVLPYLQSWKKKAKEFFKVWIEKEQELGQINPSIPTETVAHFLVSMSMSIADLLQDRYAVDFDENVRQGKALYAENLTEYYAAVADLIGLLKKALTS